MDQAATPNVAEEQSVAVLRRLARPVEHKLNVLTPESGDAVMSVQASHEAPRVTRTQSRIPRLCLQHNSGKKEVAGIQLLSVKPQMEQLQKIINKLTSNGHLHLPPTPVLPGRKPVETTVAHQAPGKKQICPGVTTVAPPPPKTTGAPRKTPICPGGTTIAHQAPRKKQICPGGTTVAPPLPKTPTVPRKTAICPGGTTVASPLPKSPEAPRKTAICPRGTTVASPTPITPEAPKKKQICPGGTTVASPPPKTPEAPRKTTICPGGTTVASPPPVTPEAPRKTTICPGGTTVASPLPKTPEAPRKTPVCPGGTTVASPPSKTPAAPRKTPICPGGTTVASPPPVTPEAPRKTQIYPGGTTVASPTPITPEAPRKTQIYPGGTTVAPPPPITPDAPRKTQICPGGTTVASPPPKTPEAPRKTQICPGGTTVASPPPITPEAPRKKQIYPGGTTVAPPPSITPAAPRKKQICPGGTTVAPPPPITPAAHRKTQICPGNIKPIQDTAGACSLHSTSRTTEEDLEVLEPCLHPEKDLIINLKKLGSVNWEEKAEGLICISALAQHHPERVKPRLQEVCTAVMMETQNQRSAVACAAIETMAYLYAYLKNNMDTHVGLTGSALLLKLQDFANSSLSKKTNQAMEFLVKYCNPNKVLTILVKIGLSHVSTSVRNHTAQYFHLLANRIGVESVLKGKLFLGAIKNMAVDRSPNVRAHGHAIIQDLCHHPDFMKLFTVTGDKDQRQLEKIIKKLKKQKEQGVQDSDRKQHMNIEAGNFHINSH